MNFADGQKNWKKAHMGYKEYSKLLVEIGEPKSTIIILLNFLATFIYLIKFWKEENI